jgi:hypothetical protein
MCMYSKNKFYNFLKYRSIIFYFFKKPRALVFGCTKSALCIVVLITMGCSKFEVPQVSSKEKKTHDHCKSYSTKSQ